MEEVFRILPEWADTLKLSQHTTPLARFRTRRPFILSDAHPDHRAFAEARCEVIHDNVPVVMNMALSGSVLAVQGAGGWKNRASALHLYDVSAGKNLKNRLPIDLTLPGIAQELQLDSSRKLVYVADEWRVKTYRWDFDLEDNGLKRKRNREGLPVHTLNSVGYTGPMVLKENGLKVVRAGRQGLAVWHIDILATHGEEGTDIIGSSDETYREADWQGDSFGDGKNTETSKGSAPKHRLTCPVFSGVGTLVGNPRESKEMIVGYGPGNGMDELPKYGAVSVDSETKQATIRHVGHGGHVICMRTNDSEADPSTFMTAATDGVVRLYDVRAPAPVLAVYNAREVIGSALYEHVGGHPCEPFPLFSHFVHWFLTSLLLSVIVIGGGTVAEPNKSKFGTSAPNFLSTNSAQGTTKSAPSHGTALLRLCSLVQSASLSGTGGPPHYDYRRIQLPKDEHGAEEDRDDDDDLVFDLGLSKKGSKGVNWPSRAYHSETAFGRVFDSAGYRVCTLPLSLTASS